MKKDLLVLTADQDAYFTIQSILKRIPEIENISSINFDVFKHPQRDAGALNHAIEFVRPYLNDYKYLLVMFDYEGCGQESKQRSEIESKMETDLAANGWAERNACVIFEPELEAWLWVNETFLNNLVDWVKKESIYAWLQSNGFQSRRYSRKPDRPKEAFGTLLREQKIPRSSSIFKELATQASYKECVDPSFKKFIATMRTWFGNQS